MWEWEGDEFSLQEDVSKTLWNDVSLNEEDLSYMFDETTPAKACDDLAYQVTNSENKDTKICRPASSQAKRRRMLQFDSEILDLPYCDEVMPSTFLKTKDREEDRLEEAFSKVSQWVSEEDTSLSCFEGLDPSSEGWLANCFNDAETHLDSDVVDRFGAYDVQNAGFRDTLPQHEDNMVRKPRTQTRKNIVFKGKKSYMQTQTKVTSSVVYPFAFIKPCGIHGDVTLKDINQRICTPPKPKQRKEESYPTSAFSGKPVVGQTKIHTEGGRGCITIMRTKG